MGICPRETQTRKQHSYSLSVLFDLRLLPLTTKSLWGSPDSRYVVAWQSGQRFERYEWHGSLKKVR